MSAFTQDNCYLLCMHLIRTTCRRAYRLVLAFLSFTCPEKNQNLFLTSNRWQTRQTEICSQTTEQNKESTRDRVFINITFNSSSLYQLINIPHIKLQDTSHVVGSEERSRSSVQSWSHDTYPTLGIINIRLESKGSENSFYWLLSSLGKTGIKVDVHWELI